MNLLEKIAWATYLKYLQNRHGFSDKVLDTLMHVYLD